MRSAFSDSDAQAAIARWGQGPGSNADVALRTYTARLIGAEASLVLHGGGNTSVKTSLPDDLGRPVEVLCVKGSGWDLATIEPAGHPAVRLGGLQALRELDALSDEAMVNAARVRLLDAGAPNPSVETLLHAFLPHRFIDHSHADAILAVVDQPHAEDIAREIYGDRLAVVPYIMPGFALAKLAARVFEDHPDCEGLLLLRHGLFTFGDSARQSYERHVDAVSRAEAYAAARPRKPAAAARPDVDWVALAPVLRGRVQEGSRRYVLHLRTSPGIRAFVDDPRVVDVAGRGPVTPDHVIRTKPWPLVLPGTTTEDVAAAVAQYRERYRDYVRTQKRERGVERKELDPDPRVVLVPGLGLVGLGADEKAARIAADLYEHTIEVIGSAEAVGRYEPLPAGDLFDMEYWSLEQAKLGSARAPALAGRVVLVTGAGSGIGAATARAFAAAGAHVVAWDRDRAAVEAVAGPLRAMVQEIDVCDEPAVRSGMAAIVRRFGGLDGVVSNAGTAPQAVMAQCPPELLRASLEVNLLSHQWVAAAAVSVLAAQGRGGFLLFNASKSAFNPGPGFGPYAVAKAGLLALMRQYAVEGGPWGIRANAINADRIRTRLLDADDVEARAAARGLTADAYYRSNLLGREVTADDVGQAFLALALAEATTGTVLTVDGGNIAAAPR